MAQNDPKRPGGAAPPNMASPPSSGLPANDLERVDDEEGEPLSNYYLASVVATGIAATVVAVFTSSIGLQGTLIGATAGAMVGSISSEVAKKHLARVELAANRRFRARRKASRRVSAASVPLIAASSMPEPAAPTQNPRPSRFTARAMASAFAIGISGFLAGMAVISVIETANGQPLSATTSGEPSSGTTISHIVDPIVQEQREPARPAAPAVPPVQRSTDADSTAEALATRIPTSAALVASPGVSAETPNPSPSPSGVAAIAHSSPSPVAQATTTRTPGPVTQTPGTTATIATTSTPTASPRPTSPPGSPVVDTGRP